MLKMNQTNRTGRLMQSILFLLFMIPVSVFAASQKEIDIKVDVAMEEFRKNVNGAEAFLSEAEGVLVFPENIKAGIGIGGEYGEGALQIDGKTIDYYKITGASIGVQLGGQVRSVILVFLEQEALDSFRNSSGWEIGVDGSVAFVETGVGKDINSVNVKKPVVGFVTGNKGLMFNLTLEGSKISRLNPAADESNKQANAEDGRTPATASE